jgi:hypothetical protein
VKMGTRVKPAYDGGGGEALCARLYAQTLHHPPCRHRA